MDGLRDKYVGCMFGLAVGDALGTTLEFSKRDSLPLHTEMTGGGPFDVAPGEWTDDTSMALCLAESLLKHPVVNKSHLTKLWLRWWREGYMTVDGRCKDIGNQTSASLELHEAGKSIPLTGSAGNGSIMRMAPVCVRWHHSATKSCLVAIHQGVLTHNSVECNRIISIMASDIYDLARGQESWDKVGLSRIHRHEISSSGYVLDTYNAAKWCVSTSGSFEEAIVKAVNLGDDADTVGAVTGQLAGAKWGLESIPKRWQDQVCWGVTIKNLANALYDEGEK